MSELDGPFTVGLNFLQKIGFYVTMVTRELEVLRQRLRARKLCISSIIYLYIFVLYLFLL